METDAHLLMVTKTLDNNNSNRCNHPWCLLNQCLTVEVSVEHLTCMASSSHSEASKWIHQWWVASCNRQCQSWIHQPWEAFLMLSHTQACQWWCLNSNNLNNNLLLEWCTQPNNKMLRESLSQRMCFATSSKWNFPMRWALSFLRLKKWLAKETWITEQWYCTSSRTKEKYSW